MNSRYALKFNLISGWKLTNVQGLFKVYMEQVLKFVFLVIKSIYFVSIEDNIAMQHMGHRLQDRIYLARFSSLNLSIWGVVSDPI